VFREAIGRVPQFDRNRIGLCMVGCATQEGEQGMNLARWVALHAGIPVFTPAVTSSMGECSSMAALDWAALSIQSGTRDAVIVGGVESMTLLPLGGYNPSPSPRLMDKLPMAMTPSGIAAENVAARCRIDRKAQDEYAELSFARAKEGWNRGFFQREVAPLTLKDALNQDVTIFQDDIAVLEELPQMNHYKPAFLKDGTVTRGNSTFAADGAVALLLMSKKLAEESGIPILMKIRRIAAGGISPDLEQMAMIPAINSLLEKEQIGLKDIDFFELHEGYAAGLLACVHELKIEDRMDRINCYGGALSLGCPIGAEGTRLISTLINVMHEKSGTLGLAAVSAKGGLGCAALLERV